MINYNNGKVYKILPKNGNEKDIYIGSTTKQYLSQRWANHKSDYKRWKEGRRKDKIMAFDIFDKYGIDICDIVLIEHVKATSKDELLARVKHYINNIACVNKYNPLLAKDGCIENKDKLNDQNKTYRELHKEEIQQRKSQYYKDNKETLLSKAKEKYQCECGAITGIYDKQKHFRSQKNCKFIEKSL